MGDVKLVPFTKTAETEDGLIAKLLARGLVFSDGEELRSLLRTVGYYRMSGYLHSFRLPDSDKYKPGTTLEMVWRLYSFDRRMRLVAADALARIEIALRTLIVETHTAAQKGDPFAYANAAALPKFSPSRFSRFIAQIDDGVARAAKAAEPPVTHFRAKYSNLRLPVWAAMEYASFGDVTTYYEGLDVALQQKIGDVFSAWPSGLVNWLEVIRRFRNICAHQGRIWNRKINTRLKYNFSNNAALSDLWACVGSSQSCGYTTVFAALSLCAWLLKCVRPQSRWTDRLKSLLADYPEVPLSAMGFPANWQSLALWQ